MRWVFVFGYGSLLRAGRGIACRLGGHRRGWHVAMDNRETVPGYKVYVDRDGRRPPVHVAYLSIRPAARGHVNGVALPVTADELEALDERERNYDRRDVTDLIEGDLDGPVYAYVGSADGRRRLAAGRADGTAVIASRYLEAVRAAFAARGMLAEFEATTDPPAGLPVRDLLRRDLDSR